MSDSITRRQLEELMMSLSFNIHTNEDIQFLNQLYNNNQADMYIFRLTNTKKYFESIIIPYCKEHWKEIIKTITNENIKNEFILNFGVVDNNLTQSEINNEFEEIHPLINNNEQENIIHVAGNHAQIQTQRNCNKYIKITIISCGLIIVGGATIGYLCYLIFRKK